MFAAVDADGCHGPWVGPSATDSVTVRIHAFRRVPDRELAAVIAGVNQQRVTGNRSPHLAAFSRGCSPAPSLGLTVVAILSILVLGVLRAEPAARR